MKRSFQGRQGFTLIEAVISMSLLMMVIIAAVNGWQYVVRGERLNSVQNELDIDVRNTMERLRNDLRLSSMDHIFVYPQGVGTNTAISFPKARPDPGTGLVALNTNTGLIEWDLTVIYHVWVSTPNELRLTLFDKRDPTLTDAQRQAQLEAVVTDGHGANTFNGANAYTRALFRNLFTWDIRGRGAQFDCYSPTLERMRNVMFGTALLNPGDHTFQFTAIGKNPASSGFKIGLDTLVVSPSGLEREAEDQSALAVGGFTSVEYMGQGAWSGNNQLTFDAAGPGSKMELTMENDRWEETNFRATGSLCEDTEVVFDHNAFPKDFVVTLHGMTNTWLATLQTGDSQHADEADVMRACAVRVLVRGGQMMDGGAIEYNGPLDGVIFRSSPAGQLRILAAFIAESAATNTYTPDAVDGGERLLFPGNSVNVSINPDSFVRAYPATSFTISKEKNYVISYLVNNHPVHGNPAYWQEYTPPNPAGTPPGSFVIPGSAAPTEWDARKPHWSADPNVTVTARLYGVQSVSVLAPTNATFTSQIADTGQEAPQYQNIHWTAIKPAGTDVRMRVRTGDEPDMSDATPWTNIVAMAAPGGINPGNKRYIQFQALLTPNNAPPVTVPTLKDVTIRWQGITRLTDVGGTITMGPDYGVMEVTVNSKPLIKGMTVDLTIYKDVAGFGGVGSNRLTSTITAEVEPRNTGK